MRTVATKAKQCHRLLGNAACTALGKGMKRGESFLAVVKNKGKALRSIWQGLRQGHEAAGLSNLVIGGGGVKMVKSWSWEKANTIGKKPANFKGFRSFLFNLPYKKIFKLASITDCSFFGIVFFMHSSHISWRHNLRWLSIPIDSATYMKLSNTLLTSKKAWSRFNIICAVQWDK